jgi:hypothetical protein
VTTVRGGREDLEAALTAAGVAVQDPGAADPPYAVVFGGGSDMTLVGGGAVEWRYRTTLVAGAWDAGASADELDTLTLAALSALYSLTGWRVISVDPDTARPIAGGLMLTRDIIAGTPVHL